MSILVVSSSNVWAGPVSTSDPRLAIPVTFRLGLPRSSWCPQETAPSFLRPCQASFARSLCCTTCWSTVCSTDLPPGTSGCRSCTWPGLCFQRYALHASRKGERAYVVTFLLRFLSQKRTNPGTDLHSHVTQAASPDTPPTLQRYTMLHMARKTSRPKAQWPHLVVIASMWSHVVTRLGCAWRAHLLPIALACIQWTLVTTVLMMRNFSSYRTPEMSPFALDPLFSYGRQDVESPLHGVHQEFVGRAGQ